VNSSVTDRKHAISLLGAAALPKVAEALWRIWKVSKQTCGKRLVAMREL
jgi:hypothetical protein